MIWEVNFSCASMTKLTRRKVLLTGLAAGTASAIAAQQHSTQAAEPLAAPPKNNGEPQPSYALFDYDGDPNNPPRVENGLVQPTIPYDRDRSKLLIQCCDLAYEQFFTGTTNPAYDGSIKSLKSYTPLLDGYTQVASFKAQDDLLGISLQGTVIPEILRQLPSTKSNADCPKKFAIAYPEHYSEWLILEWCFWVLP